MSRNLDLPEVQSLGYLSSPPREETRSRRIDGGIVNRRSERLDNLVYTGITRAKRLLVVVGQRKALGLAVRNDQSRKRYSGLLSSLKETSR